MKRVAVFFAITLCACGTLHGADDATGGGTTPADGAAEGGPVGDGDAGTDGSPNPAPTTIHCLQQTCAAPAICCIRQFAQSSCEPDTSTCVKGAVLRCTSSNDCASGQTCCLTAPVGTSSPASSACAAACGAGEAEMCDKNDAPTNHGCESLQACSSNGIDTKWGLVDPLAICQPR